jgi:hypothetical protein
MSIFKTLSEINVNNHVEQKGKFNYLSWAWAVAELRLASPTATWEVVKTDGLPFCKTECGYFVEVSVTVEGITLSQIHPVLDNQNKTIPVPNAFQINTSIQRCLVKAIALHGLGLYIYAGEDLPDTEEVPTIGRAAQALKVDVPALVKQITNTQSLTDLLKVFSEVYPKTKNDPVATKLIIAAKDEMKSLFEESVNE